jgi:hypothetical protein
MSPGSNAKSTREESKRHKENKPVERIPEELGEKLGMKPGDWFRNLCLWQLYKENRTLFDDCENYEEAIQRGLIPEDLMASDLIDLDF